MIDTQRPRTARRTAQRPGQRRWRFDVADYVRLHETGLIPEDARTELVEGEIRIMSPIGPDHGSIVSTLHRQFV